MEAVTHICTHCGYEGKPVRPPNDDAGSDGEASKALERVAGLLLPGMGFLVRPLAMAITLPLYIILWPIKRKLSGGPKHCPNCGLPLMVSLKSDAGWVAKRKGDIKAGLKFDAPERPPLAFGKEIILPGDEKKSQSTAPAPLTQLPTLEVLLKDAETAGMPNMADDKAEPAPAEHGVAPSKKPVDPEQW